MALNGVLGNWNEVVDLFVKLAPAASIVGGIFAARVTFRNNRRISAEAIAKNHYKEAIEQILAIRMWLIDASLPKALPS